jgi:hypothetical protein
MWVDLLKLSTFALLCYIWIVYSETAEIRKSEVVIEWLLFNANSAFVQLYHGENELIFNEMKMMSALF